MAVFKCKMCGGTIEFEENATVGTCEYCGTKQTLPKLNDDKKANLYDRANHFRRNNEFDKAMGIYEQILNEDMTDAEVYWSLVLCRYGIEYVEDPSSHKRVPTVNRAQFTSIFMDDDYKAAIRYADSSQKDIYEKEAKAIDDIQKGILELSGKEEPFDVFICYKETDDQGRRTRDSVLANDLYHQLTQEGFKVFFSRITLEDKLGVAYEPYIFAALNSAKVMVVLGTKPEYFNAVWVKNEWSRYLALLKGGAQKVLIPAYRDMDPYDLPEEFSYLQAQDMSRLGFMQDLIRGIRKIIGSPDSQVKEKEVTYVHSVSTVSTGNNPGNGSNVTGVSNSTIAPQQDQKKNSRKISIIATCLVIGITLSVCLLIASNWGGSNQSSTNSTSTSSSSSSSPSSSSSSGSSSSGSSSSSSSSSSSYEPYIDSSEVDVEKGNDMYNWFEEINSDNYNYSCEWGNSDGDFYYFDGPFGSGAGVLVTVYAPDGETYDGSLGSYNGDYAVFYEYTKKGVNTRVYLTFSDYPYECISETVDADGYETSNKYYRALLP